jgi:hypothetical protein
MRIRAAATIVLLLLPAELTAQRTPLPGARPGPARPAPLPPQPEPIARPLAYKRMRIAVEGYPLISYFDSPGVTGTSFGFGTRADYRLTRRISATFDVTSSFLGGSAVVETAELGTRIRPERSDRRAYPFIDLRLGVVRAYNRDFAASGEIFGFRYSSGVGGVGGVGMEYDLGRSFSLLTAATVAHSRMTTMDLQDASTWDRGYGLTSFRYVLGLRYNPVRMIRVPGSDLY